MRFKIIATRLIALNILFTSVTILVNIPVTLSALPNSLKGCNNSADSDNSNWLSKSPGYPTQNPIRNLYQVSSFRSTPGFFIVITKDNQTCYLNTKEAALKKFSEQYSGSQPQKICDVGNSSLIISNCRNLKPKIKTKPR